MALSIIEMNGVIKGDYPIEGISYFELVVGLARQHAQWFYNNGHKPTDSGTTARSYLDKKYSVSNRVLNGDSNLFISLMNNVTILLGNTYFTSNGADQPEYTIEKDITHETFDYLKWVQAVDNNIARTFELVGGINQDEAAAYNSL